MRKPIIGLTSNYETKDNALSKFPAYWLRENHCATIESLGGTPVILPITSSVDQYVNLLDGLIITGGDFDIDPKYYGEVISNARVHINKLRTEFELEITEKALDRDMPILGICGGHQIINVIFGGSLIQHIPDTHPEALEHEQPNSRTEPGHEVIVVENTLLYESIGNQKKINVNTAHHQAIASIGKGLEKNAYAPDGIIEGIEHPDYSFCLGVQWHPEYSVSPADDDISSSLIKAAARYAQKNG